MPYLFLALQEVPVEQAYRLNLHRKVDLLGNRPVRCGDLGEECELRLSIVR